MRRLKAEFVWGTDQEIGDDGWIPKGNPSFNSMRGMGVAHDTMEHADLTSGSLEEEMMAFGAMLYIRGEGGYWWNAYNPDPANQMSGDIAKFARDVFWERGVVLGKPKRCLRLDDNEEDIQRIVDAAWKSLRSEFEYDEPDAWRDFRQKNPEFKKRLAGWLRQGWWRCLRRYNKAKAYHLRDVFVAIEKRVDAIRYAEHDEELHITLLVSRDGEVTPQIKHLDLRELYPADD